MSDHERYYANYSMLQHEGKYEVCDDHVLIKAPNGTIFILILSLLCSILFFYLWLSSSDNGDRITYFFLFIICAFTFFFSFYILHRVFWFDRSGATRTFLNIFSRHIPWEYIGSCFEPRDHSWQSYISRVIMVFSKIPARAYLSPHLFLYDRLLERRRVIVVTYINELVYDRILSFCGGERGVPDDYL